MTVWRLRSISKTWHGGWLSPRAPRVALAGVSLAVAEGERVGLIGESGSGKSTLARTGLGLVAPDAGTVELFGEDTSRWSRARWRAARRDAQLLFQDPRAMLNPGMTLDRVLRESAALHRPGLDPRREAARALDEVGLAGRGGALPRELSGGELRRAGIARLLLARPRLVIADEATAGLDAGLKADLLELLLERVGPRCAVVFISHDLSLVTWACDRVVVMHRSELVDDFATDALGTPAPRHPQTLRLLGAAGMDALLPRARAEA